MENKSDDFICDAPLVASKLANEEMEESPTAPVMHLCTTFTEP